MRAFVATLAGVACQHPWTAYVELYNSLQQEWDFVKRITPYIGIAFHVVEDALWDIFFPELFQGATEQIHVIGPVTSKHDNL